MTSRAREAAHIRAGIKLLPSVDIDALLRFTGHRLDTLAALLDMQAARLNRYRHMPDEQPTSFRVIGHALLASPRVALTLLRHAEPRPRYTAEDYDDL